MKRQNYKLSALIAVIISAVFIVTGCNEDTGSGYTFKMNLAANPANLDPQLASDEPSKMIIANMMSGLVRLTDTGVIEPAAAESYSISPDELTYTFELKKDIYWECVNEYKAALTADDFVFAFQRIFNSEALFSPYIKDFMCIKNADMVSQGIYDSSKLGVRALSDHTLQIELEYPYYNFLELLTKTAAMPCNRKFFESTKGRYGLSAETTASNGAFYIKEWNYDPYWNENFIIMRRNKSNSAVDFVYPYSLNYFITRDPDRDTDDFNNKTIDCVILDNYNKKILEENGYDPYMNKSYGLIFNTRSQYLKNESIRSALARSFDREALFSAESKDYTPAYGIIPPAISVMGRSYRDIVPDSTLSIYDKYGALTDWNKGMSELNAVSLDGIKITVPESFAGTDFLKLITEQWQKNLDFFCGIEIVSQNEYNMKKSERSFDILLIELKACGGANDYMSFFTDDIEKLTGTSDYGTINAVKNTRQAGSLNKAAELYRNAELQAISSASYIPVVYGNEYFVYDKNMADIVYSPMTGTVDFRYAKKYN